MKSQKRNTQNLNFKEENSVRFYSWGLQQTVVKKSLFNSVLSHHLFFFFFFFFFCRYQTSPFPLRTSASVRRKVYSPLLGDDGGVVVVGLLILSYQSNCWQAEYDMGWGIMDFCWTCLEKFLELPISRYLFSLYCDLMDQFEGSRRLDDH